jgi:hypothetical protein
MTFFTLPMLAMALASPSPDDCSIARGALPPQHVFTNADLDRMSACRYQTGAQSEVGTTASDNSIRRPARSGGSAARPQADASSLDAREADWRAQWRSVDQKARRLRREARELRQEAAEAPQGPKKPATGRRSSALLVSRARSIEAEARELEDEFQERARREGALPGWLRPKAR